MGVGQGMGMGLACWSSIYAICIWFIYCKLYAACKLLATPNTCKKERKRKEIKLLCNGFPRNFFQLRSNCPKGLFRCSNNNSLQIRIRTFHNKNNIPASTGTSTSTRLKKASNTYYVACSAHAMRKRLWQTLCLGPERLPLAQTRRPLPGWQIK